MRIYILWAIIAILLGVSLFGIYKSIELVAKNFALSNALSSLNSELDAAKASLAGTRQSLGDAYLRNAELEGQLAVMDKRLNRQEEDIKGYLDKISSVSEKLKEVARANAALYAENRSMAGQALRSKLETQEMRKKLSSISELKKAIKELKVRISSEKKSKAASAHGKNKTEHKKKVSGGFVRREIAEQFVAGNGGFLIKDGRPTFVRRTVDIRVIPAGTPLSGNN